MTGLEIERALEERSSCSTCLHHRGQIGWAMRDLRALARKAGRRSRAGDSSRAQIAARRGDLADRRRHAVEHLAREHQLEEARA